MQALEKKYGLLEGILTRREFLFERLPEGGFQIGSPEVNSEDFRQPLSYSLGGLAFGGSLFWLMGPLEAIAVVALSILGLIYTWLLYQQKLRLSKTTLAVNKEGAILEAPKTGRRFIAKTEVDQIIMRLDPEDRLKMGSLILTGVEIVEIELIKLKGDNQKYIKDDLEKIQDFVWRLWDK